VRRSFTVAIVLVATVLFVPEPLMADDLVDDVVEERITPALPSPFAAAALSSPYNFEFTGEDALRLTVHNSKAGVVVGVHYRMHTPDNHAFASRELLAPASDRTASSGEFSIGRGYLQNVTLFATAGSPVRGQTFARLQVIRGRGAAAIVLGTIVQGYVTGNQDRAWPGSPIEGSLEGDGYIRQVTGTDPAAGVEISETVPAGARWEPLTLCAAFVTSAAGGNRRPHAVFTSGVVMVLASPAPNEQGASVPSAYYWAQGTPYTPSFSGSFVPGWLPTGGQLLAGDKLGTNTINFNAGDNWGTPTVTVREWLEAP